MQASGLTMEEASADRSVANRSVAKRKRVDQRDRSGRKQDRSGRQQPSGAQKKQLRRAKAAVAEAGDTAAGSVAAAELATAAHSVEAGPAIAVALSSMTAGSMAAGATAASSIAAAASSVVAAAAISVAAVLDSTDPYAEWGSDSDADSGFERAEIREADYAAHEASVAQTAEDLQLALRARDSAEADWHPDWFVQPLISEFEIERLQNIVANEKGLMDLNLIPASQLSRSTHNLGHMTDLHSRQQCRAVVMAAIAYVVRDYHLAPAQYPGLDLDMWDVEPTSSPYAHFNAPFLGMTRKQYLRKYRPCTGPYLG